MRGGGGGGGGEWLAIEIQTPEWCIIMPVSLVRLCCHDNHMTEFYLCIKQSTEIRQGCTPDSTTAA